MKPKYKLMAIDQDLFYACCKNKAGDFIAMNSGVVKQDDITAKPLFFDIPKRYLIDLEDEIYCFIKSIKINIKYETKI